MDNTLQNVMAQMIELHAASSSTDRKLLNLCAVLAERMTMLEARVNQLEQLHEMESRALYDEQMRAHNQYYSESFTQSEPRIHSMARKMRQHDDS